MPADQPPPQVRVTLPDGQDVLAVLHERRQWPRSGWLYQVGIPIWANTHDEGIDAHEFRVWLAPGEQVHAIDGVSYDHVPTHALPPGPDQEDPNRWAWKVQRIRPREGRPGRVVVHIWDCEDAPKGGDELTVEEALEVLRNTAGAVACKECGCAVALGPLLAE